jgi:MFS family permease
MLGIAMVTTPLATIIPIFSFAVGTGAQIPALQSLTTNTVSDSQRGAALGLYQSAFSLAIIFGGAIAGVLFARQPALPFWIGGSILIVMLIPSFFLMRWAQRQEVKRKNEELQPTMAPTGD